MKIQSQEETVHAMKFYNKWFIDEQIEEEPQAKNIVDELKLVKDSTSGFFMVDHQLGGRK